MINILEKDGKLKIMFFKLLQNALETTIHLIHFNKYRLLYPDYFLLHQFSNGHLLDMVIDAHERLG
tara:strand:+ start:116 stop:313 length:198 start_codon:yes stop_codon:yes gene_type:complete